MAKAHVYPFTEDELAHIGSFGVGAALNRQTGRETINLLQQIVLERHPEIQHGDIVAITDQHHRLVVAFVLNKDRVLVRMPDNRMPKHEFTQPVNFPFNYWRVVDRWSPNNDNNAEELVALLIGRNINLHLPLDRPYTQGDLYRLPVKNQSPRLVLPVNVNGHIYYVVGLAENLEDVTHDRDQRETATFLERLEQARREPVWPNLEYRRAEANRYGGVLPEQDTITMMFQIDLDANDEAND